MQALAFQQASDDLEQVASLGVPVGAEHAHEALGRLVGEVAKLLEADCGVDVVAQDRLLLRR